MAKPNLIVLFHTHNRSDYLKETINSFFYHNDPKDFHKLYLLDDHSTKERDYPYDTYLTEDEAYKVNGAFEYSNPKDYVFGLDYAQEKGIELLHRNDKQLGCNPTLDIGLKKLNRFVPSDTYVVYIQNDCKFVRPIPLDVVNHLIKKRQTITIRLWGKYRDGINKKEPLKEATKWRWKKYESILGERVLFHFRASYSHQQHITRLDYFSRIMHNAKKEKDAMSKALHPKINKYWHARFLDHITSHFGLTTPDGLFGRKVGNDYGKKHAELAKTKKGLKIS